MCPSYSCVVAIAVCILGSVQSLEFLCPNTKCLRENELCDMIDDCDNGEDEANCSGFSFSCGNSKPIHTKFVCNGKDECGDGTDERSCGNCPSTTPSTTAKTTAISQASTTTTTPSTTAATTTTVTPVNITGKCNQTEQTYIDGQTAVEVGCIFCSEPSRNLTVICQKEDTSAPPLHQDDSIIYRTQRKNHLSSVQLKFTPILRHNTGNYTCKATVGEFSTEIPFSIQVFENPTVTLFPSTLSLQEGDQKNLTCRVTNVGAVKTVPNGLVWCGPGGSIKDKSKVVRLREGMELLMLNSGDSSGDYMCGVTNCTETATLHIIAAEVNITGKCNQTEQTYISGQTAVEVGCIFRSEPSRNLTVICQKEDKSAPPLHLDDSIFYRTQRENHLSSVQLKFTPILRHNTGNYTCKATVGEFSIEIPFSIQVFENPTASLFPSTLTLQEGDQKNLTCRVTNVGAVKTVPNGLVWCGPGGSIKDKSKVVRLREGMELLMLNSGDSSGDYMCGVTNCTETATLHIIAAEVNITGKCNQTVQTYISGLTAVAVGCIFRSEPSRNLTVICQKGATLISPLHLNDRIIIYRTQRENHLSYAQLKFTPILRRDTGNYTCKATVDEFSAEIPFSIQVFENPTVTLFPSTLSLEEGDQRNLTCKVTNVGAVRTVPASLVWCGPDGSIIDNPKIVRRREGMELLMLNSSDASGDYMCGVTNCTETATLVMIKPEEKVCPEITDTRGTEWPRTVGNTTIVLPCPVGFQGNVRRVCDVTGEWEESTYINCVREEIVQIEERVALITDGLVSSEAVKNVLEKLQEATKVNDSTAGDLDKAIDLLETLATIVNKPASPVVVDNDVAQYFVNVVDNILSVDPKKEAWQQVQKKNATKASSLMRAVASFGLAAATSQAVNRPLTINSSTMVIEVAKVKKQDIAFPTENLEGLKSSLRLSQANYDAEENVTYVATYYRTMAEFLQRNNSGENKASQRETRSKILSLAVNAGRKRLAKLDMDITLNFYHEQIRDAELECGYWNFDKRSWRTDGCKRRHINSSFSRCDCDHLTNFAILMSPTRVVSEENLRALKIISIVGCSLSILGCLVTVLTHAFLWRNVRSTRSVILMNLCIALSLAYFVFLAGVERTENKIACTAVAAILHYLFLAIFCLMFAQGIEIGRQAVTVSKKSSRLGVSLALSWGVPAVIVGITLGVTKLEGYGNDQFCWLTVEDGVLYALVGPALFIILANTVIIVAIMRVLFSTKMMIRKGNKEKFMISFRSLCVLMPVLGVTWVFGILSFNEDTVVFQYLFAIFNSLQGFLIFVMHCIFNSKILAGLRTAAQRFLSQMYESFESKDRSKPTRSDKTSDFTSSRGNLLEGTSTTNVVLTSQSCTIRPASPGIEMNEPSLAVDGSMTSRKDCPGMSEEITKEPINQDDTRIQPEQTCIHGTNYTSKL